MTSQRREMAKVKLAIHNAGTATDGRLLRTVLGGLADDAVSAVMRSSTPWSERTAA